MAMTATETLVGFNTGTLTRLSQAIEKEKEVDLGPVLEQLCSRYVRLRRRYSKPAPKKGVSIPPPAPTFSIPEGRPICSVPLSNSVLLQLSHEGQGSLNLEALTRNLRNLLSNGKTLHKQSVKIQLDGFLHTLRNTPKPPDQALGCLGPNSTCVDTRRSTHIGNGPLFTEAAFNDFLLSQPLPRISKPYLDWVRSLLRDDHSTVLTHGDLHMGNILVDTLDRRTVVTGLIDWEFGGWYPEHWEAVKARNLWATNDESDWWTTLPDICTKYDTETALDRVLETVVFQ